MREEIELNDEDREELMSFDWVDRRRLRNKDYVMATFKEISRRLRATRYLYYYLCDLFFATEFLIYLVEVEESLTWEHLAVILRHKIDYERIYDVYGRSLEMMWDDGIDIPESDSRQRYSRARYFDGLGPQMEHAYPFLDAIAILSESFLPKDKRRPVKKTTWALMGMSASAVAARAEGSLDSSAAALSIDAEDEREHGARVFEAELLADDRFVSHLIGVASQVKSARWHYVFLAGEWNDTPPRLDALPGNPTLNPYESWNVDRDETIWMLPSFCSTWCLRSVSTECGSSYFEGLYITAKRVTVREGAGGAVVFIPRYYSFRHIQERAGSDFRRLKGLLDSRFTTLRLQKTQRAKTAEARRYRRRLVEQGTSPAEAWDRTRRFLGVSVSTMEKRFWPRPRG